MKVALYKTILQPRYLGSYYLGFGLIKAYLAETMPHVQVTVCHTPEEVIAARPDVVGISSVTEAWEATKYLTQVFRRQLVVPIVVGGQHISALPATLPSSVDVGVIGEGEETFRELLSSCRDGSFSRLDRIAGIAFHSNGGIRVNPSRPFLVMDAIPAPADPPADRYRLSTVRGCPFRCTHCVECGFHSKVRQLSAGRLFELVVQEHERTGQTEFEFLDDLFIAIPRRFAEFHHLMKERGLLRRFRFWKISAVAHLLNEEIMRMAREIGVVDMGMGLESASPKVLQWFKGSIGKVEHFRRAISLARNFGVPLGAAPVFGYPGETLEDMQKTIDFFEEEQSRGGFRRYGLWTCMPLPGSALWDRGVAENELSTVMDFSTLRIGGDEYPFQGRYYYGNEKTVPRAAFEGKLKECGYWARIGTEPLTSPLLLQAAHAPYSAPFDRAQKGSPPSPSASRRKSLIFVWDNDSLIESCCVLAKSLCHLGQEPLFAVTGTKTFAAIAKAGFEQITLDSLLADAGAKVSSLWKTAGAEAGSRFRGVDLGEVTRYERFCLKRGYPIPLRAATEEELLFKTALYLEVFHQVLQIHSPAACFIWNGLVVPPSALAALCRARSIPVCFLERGLLPGYLVVDPKGVNFGGMLGSAFPWPAASEDGELRKTLDYIGRFRQSRKSVVDHGTRLDGVQLREFLQIPHGKRVILIANQIDHDTNVVYHSPNFPTNESVIRAVADAAADRTDIYLLIKTHPEDVSAGTVPYAGLLGERGRVVADIAIHSLIEISDTVVVRNSTVGLEALIFGKPVVCLADSAYSGKGFTFDVRDAAEVGKSIEAALERGCDADEERSFLPFMSHLLHSYHIDLSGLPDADAANRVTLQEKLKLAEQMTGGKMSATASFHRGPKISVVLPTYNRTEILAACLEGFAAQTIAREEFQVVIVDDGSSPPVRSVAERFSDRLEITYRYQENSGLAAARNACIELAQAPLLALHDDDDIPSPDYLERCLRFHGDHPEERDILLAQVKPHRELPQTPMLEWMFDGRNGIIGFPDPNIVHDFWSFYGGTSSCKKSIFRFGMCDPDFRFGFEDTELAIRLNAQLPLRVHYDPKTVSYLYRSPDFPWMFRRSYREGRSHRRLYERHGAMTLIGIGADALDSQRIVANLAPQIPEALSVIGQIESQLMENGRLAPLERKNLKEALFACYFLCRKYSRAKGWIDMMAGKEETEGLKELENGLKEHYSGPGPQSSPVPAERKKPRVSVVIPCYNYGRYLGDAVESVRRQTYRDFEIIIVNDGSTDNSREVAEELIARHPRVPIRLINEANSGKPAISRNNGIRAAAGEFILCLDADDMIEPTMLEECVALLERNLAVAIAYTDQVYFSDTGSRVVTLCEYDLQRLIKGNFMGYCSLYRREAWEAVGGYAEDIGYEDWDFWISCGEKGYFAGWIPKPLFRYRQHRKGQYGKDLLKDAEIRARITLKHPALYGPASCRQAQDLLEKGSASLRVEPGRFRVVALLSAHNEGDVIYHVIGDLIAQGIDVYLINHCSTDNTVSEAAKWLGKGLIKIENFPQDCGYPVENEREYIWTHILKRKEDLARELTADWFIHTDADEFRESPWPGLSLQEAIETVDRLGYSAIDFELLNFRPVDNSFIPGTDVRHALLYYERGESFNSLQVKAWKNQRVPVRVAANAGHDIDFPGRRVFPMKFILRHYPVRSQSHGLKKVFEERKKRFNAAERSIGMHIQYDEVVDSSYNFIRKPQELIFYDGDAVRKGLAGSTGAHTREEICEAIKAGDAEGAYKRVLFMISIGDGTAETELEKLTSAFPDFAPACNDLGVFAYQRGDVDKALEWYRRAAELVPGNVTFLKNLADLLYVGYGEAEEALELYVRVLSLAPHDLETLSALAGICHDLGRHDDARYFLDLIRELDPDSAAAPIAVNEASTGTCSGPEPEDGKGYDTDKPEGYLARYRRYFADLVQKPVKLLELGVNKGGSLLLWRDFFPAGTIVGLDMNRVEINDGSGRIRFYKGLQQDCQLLDRLRRETAPEGFDIIIDDASHVGELSRQSFRHLFVNHLKPGGIYVVEDWGTGYWEGFPDGKRYCPGENHLHGMVGFIKELVDECAMFDITHPRFGTGNQRGSMIAEMSIYGGQVFLIKSKAGAQDIEAEPARIHQKAQELASCQRLDDAVSCLEGLVSKYPGFAVAHNDLGVLYYGRGEKEKAGKCYQRAVELQPSNVNFIKNLADYTYIELRRMDEALPLYLRALHENPADTDLLFALGSMAFETGSLDEAQAFYGRILELDPGNQPAREMVEVVSKSQAISIVIVTYNSERTVRQCLHSVQQTLGHHDEVIVVDNASRDNTVGIVEDLARGGHQFRLIRSGSNLGFSAGTNLGIRAGKNPYVVLLNPDTVVSGDWLDRLRKHFCDRSVAAVGPVSNYVAGLQRMELYAGDGFTANATIEEVAEKLYRMNRGRSVESKLLIGFCLMLRRDLLNDLGLLDEELFLGNDDLELSWRLRSHGYRLLVATDTFVYHEGQQSFNTEPKNTTSRLVQESTDALYRKLSRCYGGRVPLPRELWGMDWFTPAGASFDEKTRIDQLVEKPYGTPLVDVTGEPVAEAPGKREAMHHPTTSIVILTWNQLNCTKECVESIRRHTPEPHQIVFVDNGSTDGTVKWLRQLVKENANYKLIENKKNLGFAKGCNQGIEAAGGDTILLLNNDTVVTEGWLAGMLEALQSATDTGIVGPMTNNISGNQRVPKVGYDSINGLDAYALRFREQNRHRRIEQCRIVGFCMLFRRSLADKIGLLDEQFGSGNFEDDDFCLRAALAGYRNIIAGDVFIHHYGSKSFTGNGLDYRAAMTGNGRLYKEKWSSSESLKGDIARNLLVLKAVERAWELNWKGDSDKGADAVLEGIKHAPEDSRLYYALAQILLENGRYQDAWETLESAPEGTKSEARWSVLAGYCREGLGDYAEAERCGDRALLADPRSAQVLNLMGIIAYRKDDKSKAEELFRKAIDLDPSYGEPWTNLGVMNWGRERHSEALEYLESGFMLSPTVRDNADLFHSAAASLNGREMEEKRLREAKGLHPLNRGISFLLIDNLINQGNFPAAMEEIEQAMLLFGIDDGILAAALEVREKVGFLDVPEKGSEGTISLCMIVKNEERHLARCLASVKGVVNEIIMVDTGSTDRTKEIGAAFGAKVLDFSWTGDFSEARNFSLSKAKGEWTLVLDADEVLSAQDHAWLKEMTKGKKAAYSFITRNYVTKVNIEKWTANDGGYPREEAGAGWVPSTKVRLFPNDRRIRFHNPVHEMVEPSLKGVGLPVKDSPVPVHHYGRLDEEKERAKGETYYLLGKKKLEQTGGDLDALCELAIQAGSLGRYDEALELWQRVLALREDTALAHFNMSGIHIELRKYEEGLAAARRAMELDPANKEAAYNFALCNLYVGDVKKMVAVLEEILLRQSDYLAAKVMLAVGCCCDGRIDKAKDLFAKLTKMNVAFADSLRSLSMKLVAAGRPGLAQSLVDLLVEEGYLVEKCTTFQANGDFHHGATESTKKTSNPDKTKRSLRA